MAAEDFYRDTARRMHRALGSYLVQWAWGRGVDCVALTMEQYLNFMGMKVVQDRRLGWLKDDLTSMFPHSHGTHFHGSRQWATLYLSRRDFPKGAFKNGPGGPPSAKQRAMRITAAGLPTAVAVLPDESTVVEAMAKVACGLEDFGAAPWSE